jgi:[protein-PII] uridylyltransferase
MHSAYEQEESAATLQALAPQSAGRIKAFLEGVPRRYLRSFRPEEILRHFELAGQLVEEPVQLEVVRGRHWYELTVITNDRKFLFAKIAGALAAWGMNIVKADAFSNASGVVIDTF